MAANELLQWLKQRPAWQQDAVRRLCERGKLTADDLVELQRQIEAANGLAPLDGTPNPELTSDHIVDRSVAVPKTILGAIGPLRNVDRLEADQRPIELAQVGVTLIYGANGSGKSGYCRIAKKLCRCLGADAVHLRGNVYEAASSGPCEVCITFKVEGDKEKREVTWCGGDDAPPELARISVFDAHAARLYVDKDRKIEFLPFELDLVTKLGGAAKRFDDAVFTPRERALLQGVRPALPGGFSPRTPVSLTLARLTTNTALMQIPSEGDLRALGQWTDILQNELDRLQREALNDPASLARARRRTMAALEEVRQEIATADKIIAGNAIEILQAKRTDAAQKRELAAASATQIFRDEPLPNLGTAAWRKMLAYAREFAAETYPDAAPPKLATGERCVLCHQTLDETARARLAAFDAYLQSRANEDADKAREEFQAFAKGIRELPVREAVDEQTFLSDFSELNEERQLLTARLRSYLLAVAERHRKVCNAMQGNDYEALSSLTELPETPEPELKAAVGQLEQEATEYTQQAVSNTVVHARATRIADLLDRKRLSDDLEVIIARRNSLEELKRVQGCKASCATRPITIQISEMRRNLLTPTLANNLKTEIENFDLHHIPHKLKDRGDEGSSRVQIDLGALQEIDKNSDILSEGEQRALALAGFLAELNEIGGEHGIIVDDPVSSLDHSRMEAVAKRLVEVGAARQVIIFTHNLFFHYAVRSQGVAQQVVVHQEWISRDGAGRFGVIDPEKRSWLTMKVGDRLNHIVSEVAKLKKTYDYHNEENRPVTRHIYTLLRETWERAVEELLFADAVVRFRPEIKTQNLRMACFEQSDHNAVYLGMTRCSRFSGHDASAGSTPDLPTMEAIDEDVQTLRSYVAQIKVRQKRLSREGEAFEKGPQPTFI